jgi:hypothetical protein
MDLVEDVESALRFGPVLTRARGGSTRGGSGRILGRGTGGVRGRGCGDGGLDRCTRTGGVLGRTGLGGSGRHLPPVADDLDVLLGQAEVPAQAAADGRDGQRLARAPGEGAAGRQAEALHGLVHQPRLARGDGAADEPVDLDVGLGGDVLDVIGGGDLDDDVAAGARRRFLEPPPDGRQGGLVGDEEVEVDAFGQTRAGLRPGEADAIADRDAEGPVRGEAGLVADDVDGEGARFGIDAANGVVAGAVERLPVPLEAELLLLTDIEGCAVGRRDDEFHVIVETLGAERRPWHPVDLTGVQLIACQCQASHVRGDVRDAGDFHLSQDDRQHLQGPGSPRHIVSSEGLLTYETARNREAGRQLQAGVSTALSKIGVPYIP